MTADKYDAVMPRIEASGTFPPDGLEYHVAFSSGGTFRVSEIWDSKEQSLGQNRHQALTERLERRRARRSTGGSRGLQHHPAVGRPLSPPDDTSGHVRSGGRRSVPYAWRRGGRNSLRFSLRA